MNEYLIYPKQFQRSKIPVEKNRCFVIMPFKDEFNYIYGVIKQGLSKEGFVCFRVDEISGATPVIGKILNEILKSRYIIADLTGCNPNVFYELGIAHSFKDAQNIIILKQQESQVPFDVTHLTYIEYNSENPKLLVATILKNIAACSYLAEFHEALNVRGIISFVKDNGDYFVEYLNSEMNSDINLLTSILNNNCTELYPKDVEQFLLKFESVLGRAITSRQDDVITGLLSVYQEVLVSLSIFPIAQEYLNRFLDGSFLSRFDIREETVLVWQTDISINLARNLKMLPIVLPWIIKYLSRTKTASIDLNRYKIEAFLMTTDSPKINEIICASIFDRNCYVREHISDIIGEKRLYLAANNLCKQLENEDNLYTAVSIIEALGKLNAADGINFILRWVKTHEKVILSEKQFFVLKHVKIALCKLVDSSQIELITHYDSTYGEFLKDYYIL